MTNTQINELVFILKDFYPTKINITSEATMQSWEESLVMCDYEISKTALHNLLNNDREDRISKNISPIAVFKDYYISAKNRQELQATSHGKYERKPLERKLRSPESHAFQIFVWGLKFKLSGNNHPEGTIPTMGWAVQEFNHVKKKYTEAVREALSSRTDPLKHELFTAIREKVYEEMGNDYLLIGKKYL